jgi:uncharacterized protein (DUF2062 family)/trans-aconitate methyltransferase
LSEAPALERGRRRLRRALGELHYRLRTEGDSPARYAAAVALGTLIGCLPLYGAHLALCAGIAGLLGLNRLITYLAAHINNPLTAPGLLALSFGVGHRLAHGRWPPFDARELMRDGPWMLGRDLFLGSLAMGVILGIVAGGVTWIVARRTRRDPSWDRLAEATARRYLTSSHFDWEFVRAKLRRDPLYRSVFARLEPIALRSVVDLGCGRGIVLALLATAETDHAPVTDAGPGMIGVEARTAPAAAARTALGARARIEVADLSGYEPPPAEAMLLLDVLHYLDDAVQRRLIALVARQLRPGGIVLVREPDAAAGARFHFTRGAERLAAMTRGAWRQRFHYRPAAEWAALFESHGLRVSMQPMSRGTPFSNVLLEARTPPAGHRSRATGPEFVI